MKTIVVHATKNDRENSSPLSPLRSPITLAGTPICPLPFPPEVDDRNTFETTKKAMTWFESQHKSSQQQGLPMLIGGTAYVLIQRSSGKRICAPPGSVTLDEYMVKKDFSKAPVYHFHKCFIIQRIQVAHSRRGVGTKLMAEIAYEAAQRGRCLMLQNTNSESSKNFAKKLHWVQTGCNDWSLCRHTCHS